MHVQKSKVCRYAFIDLFSILLGLQVPRKYSHAKSGRAKDEFQGTVLVADDHAVFRIGLMQLLKHRLKAKRVLEATSFAEVIEHLNQKDVTLAILDLGIPGLSSPKDIAQMRLLRPDAHVVVLSASDRREDILEALSAGVHGYIVKSQKHRRADRPPSLYPVRRDLCAAYLGRATIHTRRRGNTDQSAAASSQGCRRGQVKQRDRSGAQYC